MEAIIAKDMVKLLNRNVQGVLFGLIWDTDSIQIGPLAITAGTPNSFESVPIRYHSKFLMIYDVLA